MASHRLLRVSYNGLYRLVRPALHGHSATGRELFVCSQQDRDGSDAGWRTFRVDLIESMVITEVTLFLPNSERNPGCPSGLASVCCGVPGIANGTLL